MLSNQILSFRRPTSFMIACFAIAFMFSIKADVLGQPAELFKEAGTFQVADDTSDRAAERYRQLIAQYPGTREAEAAQFSLGGYYSRKFFILEQREKVQDWDSFNRAEEALYKYVSAYPQGVYLADAYHTLAVISLRRGYTENAIKLWHTVKEVANRDQRVYISKVTWSTNDDDVVKGYCDAGSLADFSLGVAAKQPFHETVNALTKWARDTCSNNTPRTKSLTKKAQ